MQQTRDANDELSIRRFAYESLILNVSVERNKLSKSSSLPEVDSSFIHFLLILFTVVVVQIFRLAANNPVGVVHYVISGAERKNA